MCCIVALVIVPGHVLAHSDNTQNAATPTAQPASDCADLWELDLLKTPDALMEAPVGPLVECIRAGGTEDPNARNPGDEPDLSALIAFRASMIPFLRRLGALRRAGDLPAEPILHAFIVRATIRPELGAVIQALIDAGADVNLAIGDEGITPLLVAIVGGVEPNEPNSDVIDALIRAGADVKHKISDGRTMLHVAARAVKEPFVISRLVAAGADTRARSASGATPLHEAAKHGDSPEIIGALVAAGADIHAPGESGESPLHTASGHNDSRAVIDALIDAGADIDARSDLGTTPLHWATSFAETTAGLEALLAAGADPNVLDDMNNLPIDYAEENRAIRGTGAYLRLIQARLR